MKKKPKLYRQGFFGEMKPTPSGLLSERFLVPPFSVLNAREGNWQSRKRAWLKLGIEVEKEPAGRDAGLTHNTKNWFVEHGKTGSDNTTSIFDPVLCELIYRWFCLEGGQVVDPFAGGSVRGIVAVTLGLKYWGCDLSKKQIEANRKQANNICPDNEPEWVTGDSLDELDDAPKADLIFSCPPYGSLEVYSDHPRELSAMEHSTFIAEYKRIILRACKRLRQNRFACFVVGDYRDKKGNYRNFISDTISAFLEQGLHLYNEIILTTAVGSLPIRVGKSFTASRKVGKTHQNVLVFVKGDGKKATQDIKESEKDQP